MTVGDLEDFLIDSGWWDHSPEYAGECLELIGSIEIALYEYRAGYLSLNEVRAQLGSFLPSNSSYFFQLTVPANCRPRRPNVIPQIVEERPIPIELRTVSASLAYRQ